MSCQPIGKIHQMSHMQAERELMTTNLQLRAAVVLEGLKTSGAIVLTIIGDHGAIRDGAHGCCGYRKGSRE